MGFKKYRTEITDNPECPEELILRKTITVDFLNREGI
jgi:hypothetical protein